MTIENDHIQFGDYVRKYGQWLKVEFVNYAESYVITTHGDCIGFEELTYDDIRLPSEMD